MGARRFFILCLVLGALWAPGAAAQITIASDIRIGVTPDRTRLVIELSDKVDFKSFALANPDRIMIDLPEIDWTVHPIKGGGLIQALRYGLLQPGVSRMVLDLSRPAKVANAFLIPPSEGKSNRLVFDLQPTDEKTFAAAVKAAPPAPSPPPPAQAAPGPQASLSIAPPTRKPQHRAKRKVIVIDPGHGGVDPGALGASGIYEKDLTLAAARDFKKRLDATGKFEVYLTRDQDIFIRLRDRIAIARAKGADLFISIHADTISNSGIRGLSVYTLSEKASDKEAADLADKENKADLIAGIDLSSESPEVTNILIDLAQRETMNDSSRFAGQLVDELKSVSHVLPNTHRFAGFAVLKAPDVPSVLVEMGFLSNNQDDKALRDPRYRAKMADALATAVSHFFRTVEKAENE